MTDFEEIFKKKCNEMGGEIKDFPQEDKKVCAVESKGIALTEDGDVRKLD